MAISDTKIALPSLGILYDGKIPGGSIDLKRMTAYELSVLFSQGSVEERINKIIENVSVLPGNFPHRELLVTDRLAILLGMRVLAFGPKYTFSYKCANCGANVKHECDIIDDLGQQKPAADLAEPLTFKLPDCGKNISVRFMRGYDEEAVMKYSKRISSSTNEPGDPSALHRQARLIVKIDGEDPGDIVKREDFVKNLSARDSIIIDNELDAAEPGIDLDVHPDCNRCGHQNDVKLPFSLDFFRPGSLRA